jgi:replication-associated recombination protein RarA
VAAPIHPDELMRRLRLDRRRCFIVTGRPGEGKTPLAKQMADSYNGQYLDLLAIFAGDSDLTANVDTFTPRKCRDLLRPHATGDLVLVDEMEFLWHCWDEGDKRDFLTILQAWSKPAFFGVFLPSDPTIEQFDMLDQDGRPRIFSLRDLQALK